jgi:hypothetical protein
MTRDEMQKVHVPLDEFVERIAEKAALAIWDKHRAECPAPAAVSDLYEKVNDLRISRAKLIGFLAGAALVGGGAGGALGALLGG